MGKEMSNPPTNQKHKSTVAYTVEQLVAVNPYNPDILPDLENYVNEQFHHRSLQTLHLNLHGSSTAAQPDESRISAALVYSQPTCFALSQSPYISASRALQFPAPRLSPSRHPLLLSRLRR
ncbi:Eukaryotic translation initiation factor 3 subunit K [Striga hermonthica]|uniref:Eukaryotic translation initiation factor 3 subunit K n=1 Tax=Striga hermonthica TaxID=68872 RepID=A0A9N7NH32_STRHE|nr:Eukaryotic translation initiation factor 3 subunit K [Striga hermonthica]